VRKKGKGGGRVKQQQNNENKHMQRAQEINGSGKLIIMAWVVEIIKKNWNLGQGKKGGVSGPVHREKSRPLGATKPRLSKGGECQD